MVFKIIKWGTETGRGKDTISKCLGISFSKPTICFGYLKKVYQICRSDGTILSDKNTVTSHELIVKQDFIKQLSPCQSTQKYHWKLYFCMKKT